MQTKLVIRIVFISLALAALVLAGVYAFLKLRDGEQVYRSDLFELVSEENELLFYFPDTEVLSGDFPTELLPDTSGLRIAISLCQPHVKKLPGTHNLVLSYQEKNGLILYRTTPDQIALWEKQQFETGIFPYPAQKESHNKLSYSVCLTADDRFFCYAYHQGVFAGSYSRSLLQKALLMFSQEKDTTENTSFLQARQSVAKASFAGCLFRKDSLWYTFDIANNKGNVWINGYFRPEACPKHFFESFPPPLQSPEIRTEFIPATTSALFVFNSDSSLFQQEIIPNQLLKKYCPGNATIAYYTSVDTTSQSFRTVCFELNEREAFFKELKALLPDSLPVSTRYVWHKAQDYIVYSLHKLPEYFNLSACLGSFSRAEDCFFTFYKNNLLVSDSQEALLQYWKQLHTLQTMKGDEDWLQSWKNNKSEEAGSFLIARKEAFDQHIPFKNDWASLPFPQLPINDLFLQFIPGEGILLYNGVIKQKTKR